MADLRDTPASLMSAVRDIMMKNQDIRQQEIEKEYGKYTQQQPEVPDNSVDIPSTEPEQVDPETVIPGSSGTPTES